MPLAQSLSATRKLLQDLLVEDLPLALKTLRELLPEGTEKHDLLVALQARLQQLNKDRIRGVINPAEYAQRVAAISADFQDIAEALEEGDFETPVKKTQKGNKAARQGSVLYRIPHKMPIRKSSLCTIRVAVDGDAILEDIVLDDDVRLRERVEVSDRMSAELIDTEGNVFDIVALNAAHQNVRDTGYTQWLFRVTPRIEGEHQLMVKVSLLEFDRNTNEYLPREVSIMETVTIVTEAQAPTDEPEPRFKSSGHDLVVGPALQPSSTIRITRSMRAMALFLAFLMLGSTATWAFTPPPERDLWLASIEAKLTNDPEPLVSYISKYETKPEARPYLDKAYFRKAEQTGALVDLRDYQREFKDQGTYTVAVEQKIRALEIKTVESITVQASEEKVRQYLQEYPDATLLPQIKQTVETRTELRAALLPDIETAYVRTLEVQSTAPKVEAFLRDFPQSKRLGEVAEIVAKQPEVLRQVQPSLQQAIVQGVEKADEPEALKAVLPALAKVGTPETVEKVQQLVAQKPASVRREVKPEVQSAVAQVQLRNKSDGQKAEESLVSDHPKEKKTEPPVKPEKTAQKQEKQPQVRDADADGVADSEDQCPDQYGAAQLHGCPDRDGDGIPDKDDRCWNLAGPVRFMGCPDRDEDGIPDIDDQCPSDKGISANKGCPVLDQDEDGIPDREDKCPMEKGDAAHHGCPPAAPKNDDRVAQNDAEDRDGDGVKDKNDKCPDVQGEASNDGCPVTVPSKSDDVFRQDNMVFVKGGTFQMGSENGESDERPVHTVTVSDFYISKFEVTNAEFAEFLNENDIQKPDGETWINLKGDYNAVKCRIISKGNSYMVEKGFESYPVTFVTWNGATAYCQWLSKNTGKAFRLPTEAEWEFAARGGNVSKGYDYSGSNNIDSVAWNIKTKDEGMHKVGSLRPNELGIYDMSGNTLEWCSDWKSAYSVASQSNPTAPKDGSEKVSRGGSYYHDSKMCRVSTRWGFGTNYDLSCLGFRVARTP